MIQSKNKKKKDFFFFTATKPTIPVVLSVASDSVLETLAGYSFTECKFVKVKDSQCHKFPFSEWE